MTVPAGSPVHGAPRGLADQIAQIERFDGHVQLGAVHLPRGARPIGVHLDAEAVGIGQVERLADGVVGAARVHAEPAEVLHEPAERRPIRKQDREVVQAQQSTPRNRPARPGARCSITSGGSSPSAPSSADPLDRDRTRRPEHAACSTRSSAAGR